MVHHFDSLNDGKDDLVSVLVAEHVRSLENLQTETVGRSCSDHHLIGFRLREPLQLTEDDQGFIDQERVAQLYDVLAEVLHLLEGLILVELLKHFKRDMVLDLDIVLQPVCAPVELLPRLGVLVLPVELPLDHGIYVGDLLGNHSAVGAAPALQLRDSELDR